MSKKIIRNNVKLLLEKHEFLRDNDLVLVLAYYKEIHNIPEDIPYNEIVRKILTGEIPKSATIERYSRLVQKDFPHLAGSQRQNRLDQQIPTQEDLGYSYSNYKDFLE